MTESLARTGVIRPDPKDPSPLRIDEALVRKMLVSFVRDETVKAGLKRAVVSSSTNCRDVLGAAGIADLFDTIVDGHAKTRAFYGCNDWSTAVNATWTMVTLLRRYPDLAVSGLVREKLTDHLGRSNLEGELAYFTTVGTPPTGSASATRWPGSARASSTTAPGPTGS